MSRPVLTTEESIKLAEEWEAIIRHVVEKFDDSVRLIFEGKSPSKTASFRFRWSNREYRADATCILSGALTEMVRCYFRTSTFNSLPTAEVMNLKEPVLKACREKLISAGNRIGLVKSPSDDPDYHPLLDFRWEEEAEQLLDDLLAARGAWEWELQRHKLVKLVQLPDSLPAVGVSLEALEPPLPHERSAAVFDGEKLKRLRSGGRYTWAGIAKNVGVTETSVKNHARGHAQPRREVVEAYAKFFNVPIEEFWVKR